MLRANAGRSIREIAVAMKVPRSTVARALVAVAKNHQLVVAEAFAPKGKG